MSIDRRTVLKGGAALVALAGLPLEARASAHSNFHAIYANQRLRDRFFLFLQNVFHLFPEAEFHQLILDSLGVHATDQAIYGAVQDGLPGIKTIGSEFTFALPALAKQKRDMAKQASMLLESDERKTFDGYLEIGSTGRYVNPLKEVLPIEGVTFIVNDIEPGSGPIDVLERGALGKVGEFKQLGNYERIDIADESLDLVTNFNRSSPLSRRPARGLHRLDPQHAEAGWAHDRPRPRCRWRHHEHTGGPGS